MKNRKIMYVSCVIAAVFILGSYRGKVALWEGDPAGAPIEVFPISLELLPQEDQAALQRGISAENRESLTRLLEDYLS